MHIWCCLFLSFYRVCEITCFTFLLVLRASRVYYVPTCVTCSRAVGACVSSCLCLLCAFIFLRALRANIFLLRLIVRDLIFQFIKLIDFHWFKNVLLESFSLQLWLFFFHKMIKFYEDFCSAWISRNSTEICVVKLNVHCIIKIQ